MTDILEQLRDQSLQLARRSFDSVDAGLAANVADAAIDEIERLRGLLEEIATFTSDPVAESAAREALVPPADRAHPDELVPFAEGKSE